jgi:hypothetical protein
VAPTQAPASFGVFKAPLVLKTGQFKCNPREILVAGEGDIDVSRRAWLLGVELHSNAADHRVSHAFLFEQVGELAQSCFLRISIGQTHGEPP